MFFSLLRRTYDKWHADGAPQIAAALSYYLLLSLAPTVLVSLSVLGHYLDRTSINARALEQARTLSGPVGEEVVKGLMIAAERATLGTAVSVAAGVIALLGAMRVFGQLRIVFDRIWSIMPTEPESRDTDARQQFKRMIQGLAAHNLAAFLMVLAASALLALSVALSGFLAIGAEWVAPVVDVGVPVLVIAEWILSLTMITLLFAIMYRILPRTPVDWRDVWVGAGMTAALFMLGRALLGAYFSRVDPGSAYGSAGSLVALLVWMNFSAQLFLFGAEFTHVWSRTHSSGSI